MSSSSQPAVALNGTNSQSAQQTPAKVIFVLGGPGAGKGTQCAHITKEYGYVHLSAGDLLRAERTDPASQYGKLIDEYIKDGKIVPVEITVNLLKNSMQHHIKSESKHNFLVDGFPRNQDNLDGWYKVMDGFAIVQAVLFFDTSEKVMEERLLKRGETSGRTDDNAESIRKRFHTYVDSTMPIINIFEKDGLARKIDAGKPVEEVFKDVQAVMSKLVTPQRADGDARCT